MSSEIRPVIFVSATSRDLGTVRRVVKDCLLTLGCTPLEQTNFPPDARSVREMLKVRLRECHSVIHIAGSVYGSEPLQRLDGEERRSYTQLEVDIARELGKPVYVFVCTESFPFDAHESEPESLRLLQQAHRARLMSGDALWEEVPDSASLERRVLAMQHRVNALRAELVRAQTRFHRWVAVGAIIVTLLLGSTAYTMWKQHQVQQRLERIEQVRDQILLVAESFLGLRDDVANTTHTFGDLWTSAVDTVAQSEGVAPAAISGGMMWFAEQIREDPDASLRDRLLAQGLELAFAKGADESTREKVASFLDSAIKAQRAASSLKDAMDALRKKSP